MTLTKTTYNRAVHVKNLSTDEYKAYARKRNGVEGVPSVLRRRYDIDDMPVRGLVRSKMRFGMKIGAVNVKRLIAVLIKQEITETEYLKDTKKCINDLLGTAKSCLFFAKSQFVACAA